MSFNEQNILNQIQYKLNYNRPFYAYPTAVEYTLIDQDHFPYKRYFRGIYHESKPVIMEREAGYAPQRNACYVALTQSNAKKAEFCWEFPCSTTFPCICNKCSKNRNKNLTDIMEHY